MFKYEVADKGLTLAQFNYLIDAQAYVQKCEPNATIKPLDEFAAEYMEKRSARDQALVEALCNG